MTYIGTIAEQTSLYIRSGDLVPPLRPPINARASASVHPADKHPVSPLASRAQVPSIDAAPNDAAAQVTASNGEVAEPLPPSSPSQEGSPVMTLLVLAAVLAGVNVRYRMPRYIGRTGGTN